MAGDGQKPGLEALSRVRCVVDFEDGVQNMIVCVPHLENERLTLNPVGQQAITNAHRVRKITLNLEYK